MKSLIHLYEDWEPVKEVFRRPKLHWYFGKWRNDPCLPVWRRGPIIKFYKSKDFSHVNPVNANKKLHIEVAKVYPVVDGVQIKVGEHEYTWSDGSIHKCNVINNTRHKLPNGLSPYGDVVWRRDIRKKLRKWHLGWFPPQIQLPIWLSFHIFNHAMYWKTKWDEFRFEYPPQLTIVFFGLSLSFWTKAPVIDKNLSMEDSYWEAMLYYSENKSLEKTIDEIGIWSGDRKFFGIRPEFINPKYLPKYNEIISKIRHDKKEVIL